MQKIQLFSITTTGVSPILEDQVLMLHYKIHRTLHPAFHVEETHLLYRPPTRWEAYSISRSTDSSWLRRHCHPSLRVQTALLLPRQLGLLPLHPLLLLLLPPRHCHPLLRVQTDRFLLPRQLGLSLLLHPLLLLLPLSQTHLHFPLLLRRHLGLRPSSQFGLLRLHWLPASSLSVTSSRSS